MIDISLIEECKGGNFNNFSKLVELTSPFAFSVAFRMLGDEDQAKDVVQETMVTIWHKLKKIKSAEVFKTWMYRIVVNKCYDQLRKKKRNPEFVADDKTWTLISNRIFEDPSSELENNETAQIINLLTNKLSPKQKAVFILSDLEEMSGDEISEITGMSKSVLKQTFIMPEKVFLKWLKNIYKMKNGIEKYNKVLNILKKSKPILDTTDDIEKEVFKRINRVHRIRFNLSEVIDFLFGWVYIGWVRRSLIAASVVLVLVFIYQQSVILKQINYLTDRLSLQAAKPHPLQR